MDDEGMRIYCFTDGSDRRHLRVAQVTTGDILGAEPVRTFVLDMVRVCTIGQFQSITDSVTFDNKIREVEFEVTSHWKEQKAKVRFGLAEKCPGHFCIYNEKLFIRKTPAGNPAFWATVDGVPAHLEFISRDYEPMLQVHTEPAPAPVPAPAPAPVAPPRVPVVEDEADSPVEDYTPEYSDSPPETKASLRLQKKTRRNRRKEAWARMAREDAAELRRETRAAKKAAAANK